VKPSDGARPWGWPRLLAWALVFSLWALTSIGVTIEAVWTASTWREVVQGYRRDAETITSDEMFPNLPPRPLRSAEDAAIGVAATNREYGPALAVRAVVLAALLALAFAYRRAFPPEARPPRRVWLFAAPLLVVLGGAVLVVLASALASGIKG
jgi:hypothetical protein